MHRWMACFLMVLLAAGARPAKDRSALAREMLVAHNTLRWRFKVRPLEWSDKLAGVAQEWADKLLAGKDIHHRPNSPYGENIFESRGGKIVAADVVNDWASESRDYIYRTNRCLDVCGHYTQLIWRSTKRVGCAVAHSTDREVWVCEYDPPGNVEGERPY